MLSDEDKRRHYDRYGSVDGQSQGAWIIADYLDVVLHVFTPETRDYYRLEDLWGDVPSVEVAAAAG